MPTMDTTMHTLCTYVVSISTRVCILAIRSTYDTTLQRLAVSDVANEISQ